MCHFPDWRPKSGGIATIRRIAAILGPAHGSLRSFRSSLRAPPGLLGWMRRLQIACSAWGDGLEGETRLMLMGSGSWERLAG